ncbi:MAG: HpcH/HpaI aldolase/citrate lyase family protein [Hyphomicrobiales bacterium]|nr:HpcH/HpaI aldolase/citrate lyase family protein [Hyphomicrobiales bacterium]
MIKGHGLPVIVRINSNTEEMASDLNAKAMKDVDAIMLPKVETADSVSYVHSRMPNNAVPIIAMIEGPMGLIFAENIASKLFVSGLCFGPEDYAAEMGISSESKAISLAAGLVAIAAAAHGKPSWGLVGSIANFSDHELFREAVIGAKELGMTGALAIHPAQLAVIRSVYAPTDEEVVQARRIVEEAQKSRGGAFKLDNRMIDEPVIRQARRVLLRGPSQP